MRDRPVLGALANAMALLAATSWAHAGGFAVREQSAFGQGSSFAGVAAGGSLSSTYWNPATLNEVMGLQLEAVASGVFPINDVTTTGPITNDESDIGKDGFVPTAYAAYRWNEDLVVGIAVNAPFGLKTEYSATSPIWASGVAGTSEVFSINVNPVLSYRLFDWLAVGAGVQIQYFDARLSALGAPGSTIEGDDIAAGFTAGLVITPMEGTEIGLGYRSYMTHDLDGSLTGVGSITLPDFTMPDTVSLGVRHRFRNSAWTAMATAEWSNWSRFGTFPIVAAGGVTVGALPFEYNDGWFVSVGGEYEWDDGLTLRGGVGWEWSPLDDGNRTFRLPDDDRLWLSIGGSYKANERLSFDFGYSFVTAFDTEIFSAATGGPFANGPFTADVDSQAHIVSAALKYRFGR